MKSRLNLTKEQIENISATISKENDYDRTYDIMVDNIRRIREEKGISQSEFARMCGYSLNFISLVERHQRALSVESLIKTAKALDVEIGTLAGETDSEGVIPELRKDLSRLSVKEQQKVRKIVRAVFFDD